MSDNNKAVDVILHCQKQIKKERLPEDKLLHYLGRLSRLRITVQDLAETGIGRTVNSLSRNEGQIGAAADTLVRRWKLMVSEQQNQAEQRRESEEESDSNSGSSEDDEEDDEEDVNQPSYTIDEQRVEANDNEGQPYNNSNHSSNVDGRDSRESPVPSHRKRDFEEVDDDLLNDDIEDPYMENGFLNMSNVHSDGDDDEEEDFEEDMNGSENSDRLEIDDDEDHSSHRNDVKPDIYNLNRVKNVMEDRENKSSPLPISKSSSSSSNSHHHKSQENGDKKSGSSISPTSKSHHHNHERSSEKSYSSSSKEHKHQLSSKESSSKERPSKHGGNGEQISSSQQKSHQHPSSSKSEKSKEFKSDPDKSIHHKEKDKHHRSKESTSTSSSHRDRDKEKDVKSEKDRSSKDQRIKESSDHRSSSSSGSNKDKNKIRDTTSSSSSSYSPKKSSLENSVKKEPSSSSHAQEDRKRKESSLDSPSTSGSSLNKKSKLVIKEEIDSTSGINFADVLGSLDTPSSGSSSKHSSSKKDKKKEESDKEHRAKKHHESHHQSSSSSSKKHESSSSSKHSSSSKDAGSSSKKRHDIDSSGTYKASKKTPLPQSKIESVIQPVVNISPNYKPMTSSLAKLVRPGTSTGSNSNGLAAPPPISITQTDLSDLGTVDYWDNNGGGANGEMSQEDAISTMLSNRNKLARSKVFSGNKTCRRGEVSSLYDLCMQVIKDNIGDLGYTGGIPYDILKPALERANPQQLMSIESQNEYLIGETDELWQFHSKRDFRAKCPGETESWRELYERCTEEQRVKFEMIKKQMKRNIAKAEPVRTTKLAYVDNTLGPRFNKHKAQTIKNGMKTLKIKEEKGPSRGVSSSASASFNNPKKTGDSNNVVVQEASVIIASESRAGHAPAPSVSREASAAKIKPRKAPLMQKTMKLIKSLHRR